MAVLRGQQFAGGLGDAGGPGAAGRVPGLLRAGCRAPRQLLRAGAAPRAAAKAFGTAGSPTCGIAYDEGNILYKIVAGEVPCARDPRRLPDVPRAQPAPPQGRRVRDLLRELPRLAVAAAAATGGAMG